MTARSANEGLYWVIWFVFKNAALTCHSPWVTAYDSVSTSTDATRVEYDNIDNDDEQQQQQQQATKSTADVAVLSLPRPSRCLVSIA